MSVSWVSAQLVLWVYELANLVSLPSEWGEFIWGLAISEVFIVDGGCAHTGMCCTGLTLINDGRVIRSDTQFQKVLSRRPDYRCFLPRYTSDGAIASFSCMNLLPNNRCGNYENRPKICRQYPYSAFIMHGYIPKGCGYKVRRRTPWGFWVSSATTNRLDGICSPNLYLARKDDGLCR